MKQSPLRRSPQGLKAGSLKRKTAPRRSQPKRDWSAAREKVEEEGRCRLCGDPGDALAMLEAAHVIGRKHDLGPRRVSGRKSGTLLVHPDRIVPLCRHMGGGCHPAYDAHEIDLLPVLSLDEQIQAVRDADGVENMRVRTAPSCYRGAA